jgi:hypothetical protein
MGATIDLGINWTWALGFKTKELAQQFNQWCQENFYETRGVYPSKDGTASVRYRLR